MKKLEKLFFIGVIINMILIFTSISCMVILVSSMSKMSENQIEQPLDNGSPTTPTPTPEPEDTTPPAPKYYEMSADGKYIYFGEYPQSLKKSNVTIIGPSVVKDYYVGSDGERYKKNGENYYKVEKLKWRILKQADGKAFVVCDTVIDYFWEVYYEEAVQESDTQTYYWNDEPFDYEYSNLRKFLTRDFYDRAFNDNEKSIINLTEVDNSASQTSEPDAEFNTKNTFDYVFALSYAELTNSEYGFSTSVESDLSRIWKASDYSISRGCDTYTIEELMFDIQGDFNHPSFNEWYQLVGNAFGIAMRTACSNQWDLHLVTELGSIYARIGEGPTLELEYNRSILPAMYINL